jgi:hypothetical protein
MRNTADVKGGKPIAVLLQSISGASAVNPLVAFYDVHGKKREVLFLYFVPDTTRDIGIHFNISHLMQITCIAMIKRHYIFDSNFNFAKLISKYTDGLSWSVDR